MLYGEKINDFTQLTEVLKSVGFSDSLTEIGLNYMNGETADESLLDGLTPITAKNAVSWEQQRILENTTQKLFAPNEELYLRYINFIFSATGMSGASLIFQGIYYKFVFDNAKFRIKALKRRFGDEAEAIELALRAFYHHEIWSRPADLKTNDPELCIKAMDMLDKYGSGSNYFPKTELCIFALNNMPLPEDDASVMDSPIVKTAVDMLIEVYENVGQVKAEQYNFVAVGMAEASPFSEKAKQIFKSMAEKNPVAIVQLERNFVNSRRRVAAVIESIPEMISVDYVRFIAEGNFHNLKERLGRIVKYDPKLVRTVLDSETDLKIAFMIQDVLADNDPDFDPKEYDLRGKVQRRAERVLEAYRHSEPEPIRNYLRGKGSYDDIYKIFSEYKNLNSLSGGKNKLDYYGFFGEDDFFKRIFTISMLANEGGYFYSNTAAYNTGYEPLRSDNDVRNTEREEKSVQFMLDAGAPLTDAISCLGTMADGAVSMYTDACTEHIVKAVLKHSDLLAECEPKNMSVRGRIIYAKALSSDTKRFSKQLTSLADDGSKVVRAEVINIFKAHKELADEVKELLNAKKQSKRDMAVSVIEEWGTDGFADELQKAFDSEKSDKLKIILAALIGTESSASAVQVNTEDMIKKLMKGSSKLDWLYSKPYAPVHKTDGSEADEEYLKAIMLSYASMKEFTRNFFASELAQSLDQKEFEAFAQEVFSRWYDKGAEAKTKWVLYFCAAHGGSAMRHELVEHIYEWGDYNTFVKIVNTMYSQNNSSFPSMRTSIAGDAVRALAMSGNDEALVIVDNISRKFKGKSVRNSAINAMASAADGLGITAEELADRIVPDLGFDENLCRVFDYGKRQFNVYIRPSLELEIYNGDKKIKTMPKPGATDDAEKANAAYEQFKEMKKLMKTAVTTQKNRLEYVLMCDRKWNVDGWKTLFVRNAIMHCFAIGLIWGIYEDGKLSTTFRYMEDGSFTTSEGDEFELPEKAMIGLVHPIELSEELKAQWTEQLSDYEIVQPFPQLSRQIYTPESSELELTHMTRFNDRETGSMSLVGKMTRFGWDKGQAEDAGFFYYFKREDVSSRSIAPDGKPLLNGYGTMLIHSGMYIAAYDMDDENVNAEAVVFFKAGTNPNYWDKDGKGFLKCSEVPKRYFSEIMLQLTSVFGSKEE